MARFAVIKIFILQNIHRPLRFSFEIHMRQGCPPPPQPFSQPCLTRPFRIIYEGLQLSHNSTGLSPYTKYDFKVMAYNDEGQAESPVTQQDTLPTGKD